MRKTYKKRTRSVTKRTSKRTSKSPRRYTKKRTAKQSFKSMNLRRSQNMMNQVMNPRYFKQKCTGIMTLYQPLNGVTTLTVAFAWMNTQRNLATQPSICLGFDSPPRWA